MHLEGELGRLLSDADAIETDGLDASAFETRQSWRKRAASNRSRGRREAQSRALHVDTARKLLGEPAGSDALAAPEHPRYLVGQELGRGGEGKVYAAFDRELGRTVALKTLRATEAGNPVQTECLVQEARVAGQLEHPSIIPVHDVGTLADGRPFYTMRAVKCSSLRSVLRVAELRERWPLVRFCTMFIQVCRALSYAHERGVVHCDLKPENVLLGDYGEVYLADWGIARRSGEGAQGPEGESPLDTLCGTPGYLAPEQISTTRGVVDGRADLFALGVILYEVLTGVQPFKKSTVAATLVATVEQEPRHPSEVAPDCPPALAQLCLRLLRKEPSERPESARAVVAEIEAFLDGVRRGRPEPRPAGEAQRLAARQAVRVRSRFLSRLAFRSAAA